MPKDFNSYINSNPGREDKSSSASGEKRGSNGKGGNYDREMELLKQFAGKYQGKSEDEVMREIYKMALEGKKNGTLSNAEIDNFAAMVAPMLDEKKRRKLYQIVEKLKR